MGLLHIAIFSLYQNFHFLRQYSLTRIFGSLYKKILTQSQYKDIPLKVKNLPFFFFTLVFCLQKRPMIHFWTYAFEHNYCLQINNMEKNNYWQVERIWKRLSSYSVNNPYSTSLRSPAELKLQTINSQWKPSSFSKFPSKLPWSPKINRKTANFCFSLT